MRIRELADVRVAVVGDPMGMVFLQQFLSASGGEPARPVSGDEWVAAFDEDGAVLGCLRIGPLTPTLVDPLVSRLDESAVDQLRQLGPQVSRIDGITLAVDVAAFTVMGHLIRSVAHKAVEDGRHSYLLGELPDRVIRLLRNGFGLECEIAGMARTSHGEPHWPVLIDGVRWLHDLRVDDPYRWRWLTDGLVVDLTAVEREAARL